MKRPLITFVCVLALAGGAPHAQRASSTPAPSAKPLDIYVVDVEGGKAALWISPSGETVLIDSGNPPQNVAGTPVARDTDRIMEVLNAAGVTKIDYMISSHYHVDHIGGLAELAKRIPIGTYVDHGPTVEGPVNPALREQVAGFQQTIYPELYGKAKHLVVKPGDKLPVAGLNWTVVISAGVPLKTAMAGAPGAGRPNSACAASPPREITTDPENGQSVGSVITLGQFRAADFADLLWNNELSLMCPTNPIGTVDLYMASNHGTAGSNSPAMVHGLAPRAAIVQNGTGKGASIEMFQVLRSSPALQDVWELHWGFAAGMEYNSPSAFIANVEDPASLAARLTAPPAAPGGGGRGGGGAGGGRGPGGGGGQAPANAPAAAPPAGNAPPAAAAPAAPGNAAPAGAPAAAPGGGGRGGGQPPHTPAYWIKVSAMPDGSFTVTNSRNNYSRTYPARAVAAAPAGRGR